MLTWRLTVDFPEDHVWVLAFRSKDIRIVGYVPYCVVCRDGDSWINTAGYVIDHITQWAYINPPIDLFTVKLTPSPPGVPE